MAEKRAKGSSNALAAKSPNKGGSKPVTSDYGIEPLPAPRQPVGRVDRIMELLQKALTVPATVDADVRWDKDDLLDVIYWVRQVVAVLCGVLWGLVPLTGFYAFIGAVGINVLLVLSWYRFQRIDEEEYGGHGMLASEGLAPAVSLFLIVWTLVYSFLHP